jgi:hypothetical protein
MVMSFTVWQTFMIKEASATKRLTAILKTKNKYNKIYKDIYGNGVLILLPFKGEKTGHQI